MYPVVLHYGSAQANSFLQWNAITMSISVCLLLHVPQNHVTSELFICENNDKMQLSQSKQLNIVAAWNSCMTTIFTYNLYSTGTQASLLLLSRCKMLWSNKNTSWRACYWLTCTDLLLWEYIREQMHQNHGHTGNLDVYDPKTTIIWKHEPTLNDMTAKKLYISIGILNMH